MAEAEQVIKAALPDANVPTSVRGNGIPVSMDPLRTWSRSSEPGSPSTPTGSPAS